MAAMLASVAFPLCVSWMAGGGAVGRGPGALVAGGASCYNGVVQWGDLNSYPHSSTWLAGLLGCEGQIGQVVRDGRSVACRGVAD